MTNIIKNEIIVSVTVYFLGKNLFHFVLVDIFEIMLLVFLKNAARPVYPRFKAIDS